MNDDSWLMMVCTDLWPLEHEIYLQFPLSRGHIMFFWLWSAGMWLMNWNELSCWNPSSRRAGPIPIVLPMTEQGKGHDSVMHCHVQEAHRQARYRGQSLTTPKAAECNCGLSQKKRKNWNATNEERILEEKIKELPPKWIEWVERIGLRCLHLPWLTFPG